MSVFYQVGPPLESGWYWIHDTELLGTQWALVLLSVASGLPARFVSPWPDPDGRIRNWEFEWDGEDWIYIGDYGHSETTPTTWVKCEPPRHVVTCPIDVARKLLGGGE